MALDIFNIAASQGIDSTVYNQMQPFIQQTVGRYGAGRNLTEADINRMTNEVVANSQRYGISPIGYGGRSLSEIARLLILLTLYNYGYNLSPFWQLYYGGIPYFLLPFLRPVPPVGRPPYVRPEPPIGHIRPPVRPVPPIGHIPGRQPRRRRPRR